MTAKYGFTLLVAVLLASTIISIVSAEHAGNGKKVVELPLFGEFKQLFMYWTYVTVGSPPLNFTVTVDTGSSDFIIPQMGCDGCFGGDPSKYYDESKSVTSTKIGCNDPHFKCETCIKDQCGTSVDYGGSIKEDEVLFHDQVNVVGLNTGVDFGAVYKVEFNGSNTDHHAERNTQRQKAWAVTNPPAMPEGMFGLGYKELVSSKALPVFDDLVNAGEVEDIFSMCLTDHGGAVVLGGIGSYYSGDIQWTPITAESFYNVHMKDVLVDGVSIGVPEKVYNEKYCIVDSGTPAPTFPAIVLTKLKETFLKICDTTKLHGFCDVPSNETLLDQECFEFSDTQLGQLPDIIFVMESTEGNNDAKLVWHASDYVQTQYYCDSGKLGTYISAPGDDFTVLGAEFMQSYLTIHDRANKRMGFAPVDGCPSHVA